MKKKKLLALMLGMVLMLSMFVFTACGDDEDTGGDEPEVEEVDDNGDEPDPEPDDGYDNGDEPDGDEPEDTAFGGETITMWIDNPYYGEALVAALSQRFPDSSFEFEEVGGTYTLDRLRLDGPADIGADILLFPHDQIPGAINENLLLPLGPDMVSAMHARIPAQSVAAVQQGGNYFGVPLRMESVALFYNLDLLGEAGLEVPTTWEEIIDAATDYNDPANNEFLIRWEAGNAFFNQFALTAHGFELFGPNHDNADAINFDTPEAIEGLEWFAGLREILPVPYGDLNWDTVHGAFVAGEVPLIITGPWSISYIVNDGAGFDWGITTIPTINGVQPITFSGNHIAAGSAFTDYPDLTRAVLEFMMSDDGLQLVYDELGVMPALMDVSAISGLADDQFLAGIAAQIDHSHLMPAIPEMDQFWSPAEGMYRAVWEGLLTPEEAAESAIEDFEAARALAE